MVPRERQVSKKQERWTGKAFRSETQSQSSRRKAEEQGTGEKRARKTSAFRSHYPKEYTYRLFFTHKEENRNTLSQSQTTESMLLFLCR